MPFVMSSSCNSQCIIVIIIIIIINECQCGANRLPRRLQGRCHAIVAIYTLKISDVRRQTIDALIISHSQFSVWQDLMLIDWSRFQRQVLHVECRNEASTMTSFVLLMHLCQQLVNCGRKRRSKCYQHQPSFTMCSTFETWVAFGRFVLPSICHLRSTCLFVCLPACLSVCSNIIQQ